MYGVLTVPQSNKAAVTNLALTTVLVQLSLAITHRITLFVGVPHLAPHVRVNRQHERLNQETSVQRDVV